MDSKADEKAAFEHGTEVHDAHVAVQIAHDVQAQKLSPWTPTMFRLYLVLACAYLCGCLVCSESIYLRTRWVLTVL
jgi:hypothetical protein